MNKKYFIEKLAKNSFFIMALTAVVSMVAIAGFIFANGVQPFIQPSLDSPMIVIEGLNESNEVTINGQIQTTLNQKVPIQIGVNVVEFIDHDGNLQTITFDMKEGISTNFLTHNTIENAKIDNSTNYVESVKVDGVNGFSISVINPQPPYKLMDFLFGTEWKPNSVKSYGILPMITATFVVTIGALVIGVPVGILTGVYLSQMASKKLQKTLRIVIDLMAAIPSVVYGFFGLMVLSPIFQNVFETSSGTSALLAMMVLGIMILPTVISMTETSLDALPETFMEGSLALGASKMQTIFNLQIKAAKSGILTGVLLGLGRAIGETMAVILVAGNAVQMISSPTDSVRTMTATIALEMGYASARHSQFLFAIGIVLFLIVIILNLILLRINRKEY